MEENALVVVDEEKFIYPSIKDESSERQVEIIKNDILEKVVGESVYFSLDFRLSSTVIDCIAKKYLVEYAANDEDEEKFLIGPCQITQARKEIHCRYLDKVNACIAMEKQIKTRDIVAVYLLDSDNSEENRQKFLLLTKKKIFVRYASNKIEAYDYGKIVHKENLFELASGEVILDYEFDDNFNGFLEEFFQLLKVSVAEIGERHPFADNDITLKKQYLDFLVDTATAEGLLTANNLMRIEYMAREFNVSDEDVIKFLKKAQVGGIKENKISSTLSTFVNNIGVEYQDAFYLDLLEVAAGSGCGKRLREKLIKILKKDGYAGERFVEHYCDYVELRKEAEKKLRGAMECVYKLKTEHRLEDNLENAFTMLNYSEALNIQLLKMEVK